MKRPTRLPRDNGEQRRQARRDARTLADAYHLSDAARRVVEEGLISGEISGTPREVAAELVAADLMALVESPTQLEVWHIEPRALLFGKILAFSGDRLRDLARAARAVREAGEGVCDAE